MMPCYHRKLSSLFLFLHKLPLHSVFWLEHDTPCHVKVNSVSCCLYVNLPCVPFRAYSSYSTRSVLYCMYYCKRIHSVSSVNVIHVFNQLQSEVRRILHDRDKTQQDEKQTVDRSNTHRSGTHNTCATDVWHGCGLVHQKTDSRPVRNS